MRLNETYPGVIGKERVITAYLNEIYYGHKAYGIAAAAKAYFGIEDLASLTPAQAALLASLPKSPSTLDPYAYAKKNKAGKLVVPADSPPVVRRDYVLSNLSTSRWTKLTPLELRGRAQGTRRPRGRSAQPVPGRPFHVAGRTPAARDRREGCRSHDGRLSSHHHARLAGTETGTTVDHCRRHRPEPQAQLRRQAAQAAQDPGQRTRLDPCAARQGRPQRRARGARLPDRRRARLHRQRRVRPGQTRLEALRTQVRRRWRRVPAARFGVQADHLRNSVRGAGPHAGQSAARHHDRVQPGSKLGAARRRPTGPRAGPGPRGAPAIAEHPGDPGARAGRQQGRRQAGRGDGHPVPGRREEVSPGRPGRRARHGRGHTARPDVRFWHPGQWWRPCPAADDPRGPRS